LTASTREASYRYGAVLLLAFLLLVFIIIAPAGDWSRAVVLGLQGGALLVILGTSRERPDVRRTRTLGAAVAWTAIVVATAAGALPTDVVLAVTGVLAAVIPLALVGGLLRLVRGRGVTLQVVAGALAIYLLLGLTFAMLIAFVAAVGDTPYFASGTDGTPGDRVYFSFTVLTTTGFGDFTAAEPIGRALAVVEMLSGQLYLVTVIGVLIGGLASRRRA
jgi:hypothetical protein